MLFCKPILSEKKYLFEAYYPLVGGTIAFGSMDLDIHLPEIHHWVNLPYAGKFWQMQGSLPLFRNCYQCIQQSLYGHSFAGFLNDGLICQLDVYKVAFDELAGHIEYGENDCGFHLLMGPNSHPVHGLTLTVIRAFLQYYFSFPEAAIMYAEPDVQNAKSIRLLELAGFTKQKTIAMSYKTANLYALTKTEFHAAHQIP